MIEKLENRSTTAKVFLFSYAIVAICKCLNISELTEYVPYFEVYLFFTVFWGFLAIASIKGLIKRRFDYSTKLLFALALYYIVWGLINISNINMNDAMNHLLRSVFLTIFTMVTVFWVKKLHCLQSFINTIYITFSAYLIVWLIITIPEIDAFRTLSTFWIANNNIRYRNYLGFSYPNIAAELAVSVIILSKYALPKTQNRAIKIIMNNAVMVICVLLNNSRGSFLALVLYFLIDCVLRSRRGNATKKLSKFAITCAVLLIAGITYLIVVKGMSMLEILRGTNREAALEENIRLLENSGRWLLGIGRLSGGFFAAKNTLYGTWTGYLEVFYFEIFITSGIIGSIVVALLLVSLLRKIVLLSYTDKSYDNFWILSIFIYMMFINLFEVYMFSYIYASSMAWLIILLVYIDTNKQRIAVDYNQTSKGIRI